MKTGIGSVLSVSQLNFYARSVMENDPVLSEVFVRGEISGLKSQYRSGHIYFSLKDRSGTLSCIMFAGNRRGLPFQMKDGDKVIGEINAYPEAGEPNEDKNAQDVYMHIPRIPTYRAGTCARNSECDEKACSWSLSHS